jgi:CheY-like chemotaxis protein
VQKILIVEDNADLALILSELLARDFEVHTAGSGEDALKLVPGFQPDAVILDLQLPGINGMETGKAIKTMLAPRHVPILALTALAGAREERRILNCGCCDAYAAKPTPLATLRTKLTQLLAAPTDALASSLTTQPSSKFTTRWP